MTAPTDPRVEPLARKLATGGAWHTQQPDYWQNFREIAAAHIAQMEAAGLTVLGPDDVAELRDLADQYRAVADGDSGDDEHDAANLMADALGSLGGAE